MRCHNSYSPGSFTSLAFALAMLVASGACAGSSVAKGTGEADTVDEGGSDDDADDEDAHDDDSDDGPPTSAGDAEDTDTDSSDDETASDDASSSGAGDEDTTAADDTTSTADDAGTTDDGESSDAEDATTDDSGEPGTVDLSGFIVLQTASEREIVIPDGTIVPVGGAIIIGRDASLGQFEDFWGVTLDDVVYIDGIDSFPNCNGDETFSLLTPLRTVVDGPTPALVISTGIERTDASAPASDADAWTSSAVPNTDATPGSGLADGGQTGVPYIAEIVDATGAGNYPYEFVEIRVAP
jgi:hypothetical protein